MRMKRRGISPILSTVLLILITIVLALIIFLWARGFIKENAEKRGEPVERSCDSIVFEASLYTSGSSGNEVTVVDVINRGNIPLYGVEVKEYGSFSSTPETYYFNGGSGIETLGAGQSASTEQIDRSQYAIGKSVLVVPIILGESDQGKIPFTCDDAAGYAVPVTQENFSP